MVNVRVSRGSQMGPPSVGWLFSQVIFKQKARAAKTKLDNVLEEQWLCQEMGREPCWRPLTFNVQPHLTSLPKRRFTSPRITSSWWNIVIHSLIIMTTSQEWSKSSTEERILLKTSDIHSFYDISPWFSGEEAFGPSNDIWLRFAMSTWNFLKMCVFYHRMKYDQNQWTFSSPDQISSIWNVTTSVDVL